MTTTQIINQQQLHPAKKVTCSPAGSYGFEFSPQLSHSSMTVLTISRVEVIIFKTNNGEDIDSSISTSTTLATTKVCTSTTVSIIISPKIAQPIAMHTDYPFSLSSDEVLALTWNAHLAIDKTHAKEANAIPLVATSMTYSYVSIFALFLGSTISFIMSPKY